MVLVGAHHAVDLVAVERLVVGGEAGEETRDLEEHLGAVRRQELDVPRALPVLPDVVGDGRIDVALQVADVRQPAAGLRVEVDHLRLFTAVAAALPGEERARKARLVRQPARLRADAGSGT